jgi:hypothetical protein
MGIKEKDDSEVCSQTFETSRTGYVLIETHQLDKVDELLDDGYNIDLAVGKC